MYRLALTRQLVRHFADLAGYDGPPVYVTQSRRTYDRVRERRDELTEASETGDYGITIPGSPPAVWINPKTNLTIGRLARTCAHEGLHAARPDMRHGPAFEKVVTRLTRGLEP
jgi:hypothetical protein